MIFNDRVGEDFFGSIIMQKKDNACIKNALKTN